MYYTLCGHPVCILSVRLSSVPYGLVTRKQKKCRKVKIGVKVSQSTSKWNANFQLKKSKAKVTGRQKPQKNYRISAALLTGWRLRHRLQTRPTPLFGLGNWTDGRISCHWHFIAVSNFKLYWSRKEVKSMSLSSVLHLKSWRRVVASFYTDIYIQRFQPLWKGLTIFMVHKKCAAFIFTVTLANVDRFLRGVMHVIKHSITIVSRPTIRLCVCLSVCDVTVGVCVGLVWN